MLKVLQYIFYPPSFVKDIRAFRVSELSVFLLFFIGLLLGYYWHGGAAMSGQEMLFSVLFCAFSYGLYLYYKVCWVPYLSLYFSIATIAAVWSYLAEALLHTLAIHFGWELGITAAVVVGYALWSLIYIVLFHVICHDMEGKRSDGMVVVRKS